MRSFLTWAAMVLTLAICAAASPAHAQLDHTWVASNGSNGSPCSRSFPCADFATALGKTNTGGEISCVDSGDYAVSGAFTGLTISKAVTIDCTGVHASVHVTGAGADAIDVSVPGGTKVVLRGLDIQGSPLSTFGIFLSVGGTLHIEKCAIGGFGSAGIVAFTTNETELYVTDTSVIENQGDGIVVQPSGGPVFNAVLDRVSVSNNKPHGIELRGASGATTRLQISSSTISGSFSSGLNISSGAQPTTITVANSLLSGNSTGVLSSGSAAAILLNGNTITNNGTAMTVSSGGAIFSYGNNVVNDNGSPGTAPTAVALR